MSMLIPYTDDTTFGASYPPSLFGPVAPPGPATDATAGSPGTFNGVAPADKATLDGITPSVATAWTSGEWVVLADGTTWNWDGSAWVAIAPGPITEAVPGTPGSLNNADGDPVSSHFLPADLPALQALGALGQTAAWATGASVLLGDASDAHWDGTAWVVDVAPAPPAPEPDTGWTVAEIDQFAADHHPPIDLTGATTKQQKLDRIHDVLHP